MDSGRDAAWTCEPANQADLRIRESADLTLLHGLQICSPESKSASIILHQRPLRFNFLHTSARRARIMMRVLLPYHPKHAIFHPFTTDFSLRSSEPSQPHGGRHKGAAVEMCVSPLGSRRRPVANTAAPGADENGTPFPDTDHRKRSFSQGFIRVLLMQPA